MQNSWWCLRTKIWPWEWCVACASRWCAWVSGPLSTNPQQIWVITTSSLAFRSGGSWVAPWRVRWAGLVYHLRGCQTWVLQMSFLWAEEECSPPVTWSLGFQTNFRPEGDCSISFMEQHPPFCKGSCWKQRGPSKPLGIKKKIKFTWATVNSQ